MKKDILLAIKNDIEISMEAISAIISATGTPVQKEKLVILKDKISIMFSENVDPDLYISVCKDIMDILNDKEFDLEFITSEISIVKLKVSEATTSKLKATFKETKEKLEKQNIKTNPEDDVNPEVMGWIKEELDKEFKEEKNGEEEMKTEKEDVKTETEQEKTIRELKEKLKDAKDESNKCKTSTLAKVGKVTLGVALLGAAAAGGYYAAKHYAGKNTTIILNNGDEE